MKDHKTWVENEYLVWGNALLELVSNFENFKTNSAVQRMIGLEGNHSYIQTLIDNIISLDIPWADIQRIDDVGNPNQVNVLEYKLSTPCIRYIYYADKILDLTKNYSPLRIAEIGCGYGGLCSIIHTIAKHRNIRIDQYHLYDLPNVQKFQEVYLEKVIEYNKLGIQEIIFKDSQNLQNFDTCDYLISFYALGEFATDIKTSYIENVVSKIPHGLILWNPHSGADNDLSLLHRYHTLDIVEETPSSCSGNLYITY